VAGVLVGHAPQRHVLRNGQDDTTAGASSLIHLLQDDLIRLDVLQHVKRSDDVEFAAVGQGAGVQLQQIHRAKPPPRELQAGGIDLAPGDGQAGQSGPDPFDDESCAAADLQEAPGRGEVPP